VRTHQACAVVPRLVRTESAEADGGKG
jgi:hypothetical protein